MSLNDGFSETYIFMLNGKMLKVILDFNKKTCTVYNDLEVALLKLEKMSIIRMNMLRGQICNYIAKGKKLRGFTPSYEGRFL